MSSVGLINPDKLDEEAKKSKEAKAAKAVKDAKTPKTTKTVIVDTDLTKTYGSPGMGRTEETVAQTVERELKDAEKTGVVEVEDKITTEPFPPPFQIKGLLILYFISIVFMIVISHDAVFLAVAILTTTLVLGGLLRHIIVKKKPVESSAAILYFALNVIFLIGIYGLNVNARFDEIMTIFVVVMVFAIYFQTHEKFITLATLPVIIWLGYRWYQRYITQTIN